jgi:hypothetical protein
MFCLKLTKKLKCIFVLKPYLQHVSPSLCPSFPPVPLSFSLSSPTLYASLILSVLLFYSLCSSPLLSVPLLFFSLILFICTSHNFSVFLSSYMSFSFKFCPSTIYFARLSSSLSFCTNICIFLPHSIFLSPSLSFSPPLSHPIFPLFLLSVLFPIFTSFVSS